MGSISCLLLFALSSLVPPVFSNKLNWGSCTHVTCPRFVTVQWKPEYEYRCYPDRLSWACLEPEDEDVSYLELYRKLRNYVTGDNLNGRRLHLTAPILILYNHERLNSTCLMMDPRDVEAGLPAAIDLRIFIRKFEPSCAYARTVEKTTSIFAAPTSLRRHLETCGLIDQVQPGIMMVAMYLNYNTVLLPVKYYNELV